MQEREMWFLLAELGEVAAGRNRTGMVDRLEGEPAMDRTEAPTFSDYLWGREDPNISWLKAQLAVKDTENNVKDIAIKTLNLEIKELQLQINDPKHQAERQRQQLLEMQRISLDNAARM